MADIKYMALALGLAEKGRGCVNPNPMVGAVIVKSGVIVGQGYHQVLGGNHAEIEALLKAGPKARGATMYVTLEPCRHFGRTPPCTREIIKAGIKKVIIPALDPNPLNNGRGLKELKENGIAIEKGLMEKEARCQNEKFFTFYKKKRPFISVKCAMTLDGKIATVTGVSRWISGRKARNYVHRLRHEHDALMAGINTIQADDPELTARLPGKNLRKPYIVIADSRLSIPLEATVVKNARENKCIIATTSAGALGPKKKKLEKRGIEILAVKSRRGRVDLKDLIRRLAQRPIISLMVEGGGELISSFFEEELVDKIYFFYAPEILGGRTAITSVEGDGLKDLENAIKIKDLSPSRIGEDLLITGYPVYDHSKRYPER